MSTDNATYEALPYTGRVYSHSHVDAMATVGTMFGMQPAPPERCRVLGLGCGDGTNLIVMAYHLPDSQFVGVDASPTQIQRGQQIVADLGLTNISLVAGDIRALSGVEGDFDYIICHGVYSWVPEEVRRSILQICRSRLRPQGIAYVSYNCYPGWHAFDQIRGMMRYHAQGHGSARDRVAQARAIVQFVSSTVTANNPARSAFFQHDVPPVLEMDDDYLFHEYLEPDNTPLYFHEFAAQLAAADLQYLGDAQLHMMMTRNLGEAVAQTIDQISRTIIDTEQYADFVTNRRFRCSLVCRPEVSIQRAIGYDPVLKLRAATPLRPDRAVGDVWDGVPLRFSKPGAPQVAVTVSRPLEKQALVVLGQRWPEAVPFAELVAACCGPLGLPPDAPNQTVLAALCVQLWVAGAGGLHTFQPPVTGQISERPQVSWLARYQLAAGLLPCSQLHVNVTLPPQGRALLPMLDGTLTRDEITALLVTASGAPIEDVSALVDELLTQFATFGLLLPEGSEPIA